MSVTAASGRLDCEWTSQAAEKSIWALLNARVTTR